MVINMSDENKSSNENIGVGAAGADVGSNPTPRTNSSEKFGLTKRIPTVEIREGLTP